jgi:hypothetical protein
MLINKETKNTKERQVFVNFLPSCFYGSNFFQIILPR